MISNDCGKRIKGRNGDNDRNRERERDDGEREKKGCWKRQTKIRE